MGDELKNAVLEALCSRGPWGGGAKGSRWDPAWTLTADEIRAYYEGGPDPVRPETQAVGGDRVGRR